MNTQINTEPQNMKSAMNETYRIPSETNWDPLVVGISRKASLRK